MIHPNMQSEELIAFVLVSAAIVIGISLGVFLLSVLEELLIRGAKWAWKVASLRIEKKWQSYKMRRMWRRRERAARAVPPSEPSTPSWGD